MIIKKAHSCSAVFRLFGDARNGVKIAKNAILAPPCAGCEPCSGAAQTSTLAGNAKAELY